MKKSQNIPKPFHWAKLTCFDFSSSHFCRGCWDWWMPQQSPTSAKEECNKYDLTTTPCLWARSRCSAISSLPPIFVPEKTRTDNPQIYAILWVSEWVVIGSKGKAAAQLGKRKNFDLRDLWECPRQQDFCKGEKISPTTLPLMMPNGSSFAIWEGWLNCFSHLSIIEDSKLNFFKCTLV